MTLRLSFDVPGQPTQSLTVSPTSINVPTSLWWLLNRLFPQGFYPFLDPVGVYQALLNLPPMVTLPLMGEPQTIRIDKARV